MFSVFWIVDMDSITEMHQNLKYSHRSSVNVRCVCVRLTEWVSDSGVSGHDGWRVCTSTHRGGRDSKKQVAGQRRGWLRQRSHSQMQHIKTHASTTVYISEQWNSNMVKNAFMQWRRRRYNHRQHHYIQLFVKPLFTSLNTLTIYSETIRKQSKLFQFFLDFQGWLPKA